MMSGSISYDSKNNPYAAAIDTMSRESRIPVQGTKFTERKNDGGNFTLHTYHLNDFNQMTKHSIVQCDKFSTPDPRSDVNVDEFFYNKDGKLEEVQYTRRGRIDNHELFKYDEKGRLEGEYSRFGTRPEQRVNKYFYDENDNVIACNSERGAKFSWAMKDGKKIYGSESVVDMIKKGLKAAMWSPTADSLYTNGKVETYEPIVKVKNKKKPQYSRMEY